MGPSIAGQIGSRSYLYDLGKTPIQHHLKVEVL